MIPTLARLEELRALCDAATSGPWVRDDWPNPGMQVIAHGNRVVVNHYRHARQVDAQVVPDMAFIAAFNPVTARECLDAIEEQRKEIERLRAVVDVARRVRNCQIGEANGSVSLGYAAIQSVTRLENAIAALDAEEAK